MLESVFKAKKSTILKYVQEKIKIENLIDDDLEKHESGSDFNDEKESDNDNDE